MTNKRTSTREEWVEQLKQWKKSGLTAEAFSAIIGINAYTFRSRVRRLDKDKRSLGCGDFVEIVTPLEAENAQQNGEKQSNNESEPLEVVLSGGRRILVPVRFDPESLRQVIGALEGR